MSYFDQFPKWVVKHYDRIKENNGVCDIEGCCCRWVLSLKVDIKSIDYYTQNCTNYTYSRDNSQVQDEERRRKQVAAREATEYLERRWGKFPKRALSVIACPFPECEHHCIDKGIKPLAEIFDSHVQRVHKIKPTKLFLELIESKINEYRSHRIKYYIDPFLHVSLESVT